MTSTKHTGLPVAALLAFAGCALLVGCDDPRPVQEAEVRPVRTMVARTEAWSAFPTQVGEIRPHLESDLGFRISGKVMERMVDLGSVVRKGDVLARLDEQDQRNQLNAAQADLASAQATLTQTEAEEVRQAQLLAAGWATRTKYDAALQARDTARAVVRATEAKKRLAEAQLAYAVLRAPEDGAVSSIGAEPGQVVAAGQMVVRLANMDKKDAVFTLAENAVLALPANAEVEVNLLDAPHMVARGTVDQVSPSADPVTRTYTVKVALSSPPDSMRLGMSVMGRVRLENRNIIALPPAALFQKDGRPAVWIVDPASGTVALRNVDIARADADKVLIGGGLPEGAIVVTAGVQRMWPGLKVRLTEAASGTGGPS